MCLIDSVYALIEIAVELVLASLSGCFLLSWFEVSFGIIIGFGPHHCPGEHQDPPCHCYGGFLLSWLLAGVNPVVVFSTPLVVPQAAPSTFHQQGSQELRPSFGDPTSAIGVA